MPQTTTEATAKMTKDSDKKHSVLFKADDKDQVLDNVYLKRPFADKAKRILVTVTVIE